MLCKHNISFKRAGRPACAFKLWLPSQACSQYCSRQTSQDSHLKPNTDAQMLFCPHYMHSMTNLSFHVRTLYERTLLAYERHLQVPYAQRQGQLLRLALITTVALLWFAELGFNAAGFL